MEVPAGWASATARDSRGLPFEQLKGTLARSVAALPWDFDAPVTFTGR